MTASKQLALIACRTSNGVIGCNGSLPWDYPEDRAYFKRITMGHTLIVGRKTYESLGGPLAGRQLIVLTHTQSYYAPGSEVRHSFEAALALAREMDDCPFVCGGGTVYAQALPYATMLYLTDIHKNIPGDTCFPGFDESNWLEISVETHGDLTFRHLVRK